MTSLAARILGSADDPEEMTLSSPQRRPPGANGVPYWRGVYGLDPECHYSDWQFAAPFVAMRLGVLVFGANAGRVTPFRGPASSPAGKLLGWLLRSQDDLDARLRFLALRLAAEEVLAWQEAKADDVTGLADDFRAGVSVP